MPIGWDSVKDIVSSALELPQSERGRYIDETCGGDAAVRSRVEELIGSYDAGHNFFRQLEEDLGFHEYEPSSLSLGEMVLDRYEVRAFLARGGSGEIYEAYDREVGERVALKILRSRFITDNQVALFRSEVRLARKIQNPAICRVHDGARFTRADGERMLVISMELLDGETLSAYVRRNAPLQPDQAIAILRQIADGLDAAHQSGIIHRDLKSANIMLTGVETGSPRAVITDFGLASLLDDDDGSPIIGTPAYMAPEQVEGQPLSAATDIYALGVIAYEMVTGKLPFGGDSPMEIARARLSEPPAPPRSVNPSVSVRWDRAILGCLALDPARRFKHASYFIAAIELSRRPWLLSIVLVAISGSALWGWFAWQQIQAEAPLPGSVVIAGFTSPNESERQEAEAFREELAAELAGVPGVQVIAQSTPRPPDTAPAALKDLRQRYRAGTLLTGSIRAEASDSTRVAVQLIDTKSGGALWSGSYRARPGDLPQVEETIVLAGIGQLGIHLPAPQLGALERRHSRNAEAYQAFIMGQHFTSRRNTDDLLAAIGYFRHATALDPKYSLAWAGLSTAYSLIASRGAIPIATANRLADETVAEALRLDPDLPEALLIAGLNAQHAWQWDQAERNFRRVVSLAPGLATGHHWLAGLLSNRGRHEDALREASRARELEPLSPAVNTAWGSYLSRARRYDEAVGYLERVSRQNPSFLNVKLVLAEVYGQLGRLPDAVALAEAASDASHRASYVLADLGYYYGRAGRTSDARSLLQELQNRYEEGKAVASQLAVVHYGLGDAEQTLAWLERAAALHDQAIPSLKVNPVWDPLRGTPRFMKLTETLGL